jgi:Tol biopolymer transport system component
MRADGSEKRQLTSSATAFYGTPTWSPDGTQVAFVQHYGEEADITIMDVNNGSTSRVSVPGFESNPSWSPDGSLIAFTSGWAVYTMRPDGGNLRLRTLDPEWGIAGSATWIARR